MTRREYLARIMRAMLDQKEQHDTVRVFRREGQIWSGIEWGDMRPKDFVAVVAVLRGQLVVHTFTVATRPDPLTGELEILEEGFPLRDLSPRRC